MAKRRRLSLLTLSANIWAAFASSSHVMREPAMRADDAIRSPPQARTRGLAVQAGVYNTPVTPSSPTPTSMERLMETRPDSGASCAITTAPILENYRRQVNDKAVTIVFLSSALSSANSHAAAISQSMASSISQLQLSASILSASASSAIFSIQASASRALQAADASASDAVLLAEESASSRVGEILALATMTAAPTRPPISNGTTYRAQTVVTQQNASVSVAVVAGAVVASIIGSTLLSILGFYLFVHRRGTKQKQAKEQQLVQEQQKQQEEEVHVSAALDRAIVSYIAKSPPTSPDSEGMGQAAMIDQILTKEPRPTFLAPPPRSSHRPLPLLPQVSPLTSPRSPPLIPAYRTHTRTASAPGLLSPQSLPQTASYPVPPRSPPGPPPAGPLPQLPSTTYVRRMSSRQKGSRSKLEDAEQTYGDILARPLTSSTSIPSPRSDGAIDEPNVSPHPDKRDSNWPLAGTPWL